MRIHTILMIAAQAGTEAASGGGGSAGERLFGLDPQLIHDAIIQGINIFILFLLLSYLLFKPATEYLKKRRDKIESDLTSASEDKIKARELKEDYEKKMSSIMVERDDILNDARKMGQKTQETMFAEAREEVNAMKKRAEADIELQKKRAADDMKKEMVEVAQIMAGKVVSSQIDTTIQDDLLEETLKQIGDETWQN